MNAEQSQEKKKQHMNDHERRSNQKKIISEHTWQHMHEESIVTPLLSIPRGTEQCNLEGSHQRKRTWQLEDLGHIKLCKEASKVRASERAAKKKTNSRVETSAACQEATSRNKRAQENQIFNKEELSNEEARHKRKSIEHVSRQSSSRHSRGQMQVNPPHSASAWPRSAHHHWIQRSHHGHAH